MKVKVVGFSDTKRDSWGQQEEEKERVMWIDWQKTLDSFVLTSVGKSILLVGVKSEMSKFADQVWKNGGKCMLQKQS